MEIDSNMKKILGQTNAVQKAIHSPKNNDSAHSNEYMQPNEAIKNSNMLKAVSATSSRQTSPISFKEEGIYNMEFPHSPSMSPTSSQFQTVALNSQSNNKKLHEDWRAVGATRRASYAGGHLSFQYFSSSPLFGPPSADTQKFSHLESKPLTTPPPGFNFVKEYNTNFSPSEFHQEDKSTPIFQYFGGRENGARSFSLSANGSSDDSDHFKPSMLKNVRGSTLPVHMEESYQVQEEMFSPAQVHSVPHLPPFQAAVRQEFLNRRTSSFTSSSRTQKWPEEYQNDFFRRSSYAPVSYANSPSVFESRNIADQYFSNDPALMQRRNSAAAVAMHKGNQGLDNQLNNLSLDDRLDGIPSNFAEQYGNFFDTGTTGKVEDNPRLRSWSTDKAVSNNKDKSDKRGPFYIVEFKSGRTDIFYVSENSDLQLKEGDLVIVEADRGKDLGKVVATNVAQPAASSPKSADDSSEKKQGPKCIYRLAQQIEVNMLLDKARDEAKALNICQAKTRQKQLPMEVVDAEYQWDRRKLTFFFVSDERIDFRELVKDLFKIYKTRIWMCAVERSNNYAS